MGETAIGSEVGIDGQPILDGDTDPKQVSFKDLVPGDFENNIDKIVLEVEDQVLAQASSALAEVN